MYNKPADPDEKAAIHETVTGFLAGLAKREDEEEEQRRIDEAARRELLRKQSEHILAEVTA